MSILSVDYVLVVQWFCAWVRNLENYLWIRHPIRMMQCTVIMQHKSFGPFPWSNCSYSFKGIYMNFCADRWSCCEMIILPIAPHWCSSQASLEILLGNGWKQCVVHMLVLQLLQFFQCFSHLTTELQWTPHEDEPIVLLHSGPEVIKAFFILNSVEQEVCSWS